MKVTIKFENGETENYKSVKEAAAVVGCSYEKPSFEKLQKYCNENGVYLAPTKLLDAIREDLAKGPAADVKPLPAPAPKKAATSDTPAHPCYNDLLVTITTNEPALLVGPAGSGKTYAAEHVAKALGVEFYPMSIGGQTTQSQLLGYMDAVGSYVSTVFRKAFELGGVFLLDEIDAGNANTLTILNAALANGYMSFPDGTVKKHADFRCIAAANTYGSGADRQYVGRNKLDDATLDRFNVITWDYDEVLELSITPNNQWTKTVQSYRAAAVALGFLVVISPRASFKGAKLIANGISEKRALEMVVFKGMAPDKVKQMNTVAREILAAAK